MKMDYKEEIKHEFSRDEKDEIFVEIVHTRRYKVPAAAHICGQLPASCFSCPVGFQCNNCGRNVPWTDIDGQQRPATCKLKTVEQYLAEGGKVGLPLCLHSCLENRMLTALWSSGSLDSICETEI